MKNPVHAILGIVYRRTGKARFAMPAILFFLSMQTAPLAAEELEPDVFAAIVDIWPIDGEYDGYYCPPDPEGDDICLGASILIQHGSIERILSNDWSRADPRLRGARHRDSDGQYLRFRMIGRHAARRAGDGRYLVVLEPTDEGHLFVQWKQEYGGGRACFPADVIDHYDERLAIAGTLNAETGELCVDPAQVGQEDG